MAGIAGQWDAVVKSPMGEQKSVMTLTGGDDAFTGSSSGPMGAVQISGGKGAGDGGSFGMKVTTPFPMNLKVQATLAGDDMEGTVDIGAFGKSPFKATRKA